MCGACGGVQQDWASPLLSTSYSRPLVARILSLSSSKLVVRATPAGWTASIPGRPVAVHRSSVELLDSVSTFLAGQVDSGAAVELDRLSSEMHREVCPPRGAFPSSRTSEAEVEASSVLPGALIPEFIAAYLRSRIFGGSPEDGLTVGQGDEKWFLKVGSSVSFRRNP